jgi:AcrR family transcriptional regulator
VVEVAAVVADEVGWDRLSLAAVAARAGVRLPSLYKHIASLDALRDGVSVLALHQLAEELTKAVLGRSGSEALMALAGTYRQFARDFPGRYAATLAAPGADDPAHAEAAEAVMRVVSATLAGYDLDGDDAVDATRALRSALHGFVSLEAAGGFGLPVDVDRSYRRLVEGVDVMLPGFRRRPSGPRPARRPRSRAPRAAPD